VTRVGHCSKVPRRTCPLTTTPCQRYCNSRKYSRPLSCWMHSCL
jgi:hypothetical protein